jgi:hypothetical protein
MKRLLHSLFISKIHTLHEWRRIHWRHILLSRRNRSPSCIMYVDVNCEKYSIFISWSFRLIECDLLLIVTESILYSMMESTFCWNLNYCSKLSILFYFYITMSNKSQRIPRVLSIQSHVVHGYVGNKCAAFILQVFYLIKMKNLLSIVAINLFSSMVSKLILSILFIFPIILVWSLKYFCFLF